MHDLIASTLYISIVSLSLSLYFENANREASDNATASPEVERDEAPDYYYHHYAPLSRV